MNISYAQFLQNKTKSNSQEGFDPIYIPDCLFDFQKFLLEWAVKGGKRAIFADTGLGKSIIELVFAENVVRKTNKNVLFITPLAVAHQMVKEAEKFGIEVGRSRDGKSKGKITITNYEQLEKFNCDDYVCCVCDESSVIKGTNSATRKFLTRFTQKMPYRALFTATPSPNDYIELGTSSEVLGQLSQVSMLEQFFRNTNNDKNPQWSKPEWELKEHAITDFWRWVSSWARVCRTPSDFGFDDSRYILPGLVENIHVLDVTKPLPGHFFAIKAKTLTDQRNERKNTIEERADKVLELVSKHPISVVWVHYNYEGIYLNKLLPNSVNISGDDSPDSKEEKFIAFSEGKIENLIIKPRIGAFGLNWQHCNHTVFFPSHCYDEKTEILTKRGWLTFGKLVANSDEVATVNPKTLLFEWQVPMDIIWENYYGEMIYFGNENNRSFDLLVTPNHRMFYKKCGIRYTDSNGWEIASAKDLQLTYKRQKYRLLSVPGGYNGIDLLDVEIPEYKTKIRVQKGIINKSGDTRGMHNNSLIGLNKSKVINIKSIPIKLFMKLIGWYLSEGSCGFRNGICDGQITISQGFKNKEYRLEIIETLQSINELHVYYKTKDIRVCSLQLANYLVDQFGKNSHTKKIPNWVKDLDMKYLRILRDTMMKGDGSKLGTYYRTVSRQLADDFMEVCLKTGIRASVRKRVILQHGCGYIYDVNLAKLNVKPSIHIRPKSVDYEGKVGCVSVKNGIILVRRNGIPIVSGNSFEQYYQGIRRFYRFGQKKKVIVDIVTTVGELRVYHNMLRKAKEADIMFDKLMLHMHDQLNIDVNDYVNNDKIELPEWL